MTKKILNIDAITNELEGASLFFSKPKNDVPVPVEPESPTPHQNTKEVERPIKEKRVEEDDKTSNRDTTVSRNHDTTTPRYHDAIIEIVRKAVIELGKEAATHRFTQDEKRAIADIIYTYKNTGIKTSENEIARIAVNFIIQDYKENGENSILEKALKALHT